MPTAAHRRRRDAERTWIQRLTLAVVVGVAAYQIFHVNPGVQSQQDRTAALSSANRATLCAVARILIASPNVYVPAFETKEQFKAITKARGDLLSLAGGIDCAAILAAAIPPNQHNEPQLRSGGGGAQSSPIPGSQLPGAATVTHRRRPLRASQGRQTGAV